MKIKVIDDACGRYTLATNGSELAKRYNLATLPSLRPNYNVAPGQTMPVVVDHGGKSDLVLMKWGLIPFWAKDPKIGYRLINARSDTIFEKPVWRSVILKKRCLIPASGFYEWQKPSEVNKRRKQPYYIHPKRQNIFSFAGVWETWKDSGGTEWNTYSIVTTEPNKEMAKVHDRMPVILRQDDEASWLESSKTMRKDIEPFLHPSEDDSLEMYKVSEDVNSPSNNDKSLITALAD
jgi:putative SOS response-associated peptidase YedK